MQSFSGFIEKNRSMKEIVKPAFMRWLIDLMKADKIIASDEIDFLEENCAEFAISLVDIEKSIGISLAEACTLMTEHTKKRERKYIIEKLKGLALSDGSCPREEALLILALSYCWSEETKDKSKMVSFKSAHIDFIDSQVLFIEPHEDDAVNKVIKDNFKNLVNAMRIGGFDFVYIPYIAWHYRQSNRKLLTRIIKYLAPALSDNETYNVLDVISNMTTKYFKNEILKSKLDIDLPIKRPSLLIKIGNSYVNGEMMSDFLVLEVESDIMAQVDTLITTFLDYQRCPSITIKNYTDIGGDFVYTGFYKTIFDLVTYRKGSRCTLVINPDQRRNRLVIISDAETPLNMGLAETAFYVFLIWESLSPRKGITFVGQGNKKRAEIQKRFDAIYSSFSGSRDTSPDINQSNTRNRMLSIIRKAIEKCDKLTEKQGYLPNTETSKIFVPIDPQFIFIKEGSGRVPLIDTNIWNFNGQNT